MEGVKIMKKIVFFNVPMKDLPETNRMNYGNTGNVKCKYSEKVYFGLTACLHDKINSQDDVKFVFIKTASNNEEKDKISDKNIDKFKSEFETVCNGKYKSVDYDCVECSFSETKEDIEKLYRKLLDKMEQNCQIIADTTFGPRMNLIIIMNALNFAERFFNAEIISILNVKVLFDKNNNPIEGSQELYDVSPFYYLNNLTYSMKAKDGKHALSLLDKFFNI